jgi:hypothetical protein
MADYMEKINIRQVTDVHANWCEQGSDEPGKFSFSSSWTAVLWSA